MGSLAGKTLFITGASRGIGLAIGVRAARDGANVANRRQNGRAARQTGRHDLYRGQGDRGCRWKALPLLCDIRDEEQVRGAVAKTVETFGGIDICVNNASAISLTGLAKTDPKRFDLMFGVNTRGTFVTTQACAPFLAKAENPHVLMLSPPLDMKSQWFSGHVAYSIAKYGMSLIVLGLADELKPEGIAVNALWPRSTIATAAIKNILGGDKLMRMSRSPEILADAAHLVFTQPARSSGIS